MKLLIENGRLVDPATDTDGVYDILIEGGIIKKVAPSIKIDGPTEIVDAKGLVVCPGFIDMHVHLREPGQEHKEDIETGSRAAVRGGFTTIACMPNTTPVNDNAAITRQMIHRARAVGLLNIHPVAAISLNLESGRITNMAELVEAGARGFSDDGRCVMSDDILEEALLQAKKLCVPVIEHAEDHNMSGDGQVNEGRVADLCGLKPIPAASEEVIVERDIRIQERVGSYLHITHISTEGTVRLLKEARDKSLGVTSDVTPHHLLLDDTGIEGCEAGYSMYKMKPPLRSPKDREALIEGIKSGVIDCIATDHAPHSPEEKAKPLVESPFGIIGMETSFPVIYDRLVRTGVIDLKRLVELYSTNPAKILHLEDRGKVKPGIPADLTILDLERPFKIKEEEFRSRSKNCPFIGWEGKGAVAYTVVNGKIVYQHHEQAM
jgi:dihydroorotase